MPLRHRELIVLPSVFFLTTSRHKHTRFPDFPDSLASVEEILFRTAKEKNVFLMVYVIMPTHVHMIAGSNGGGLAISRFMHSFKGRVRESLAGKVKFWQDRFDDLVITSEKVFLTKLNYIHTNPVRAGLVNNPENWLYSSYRDWNKRDDTKGLKFDFSWVD